MSTFIVTIPWDVKRTSQNQRVHWRELANRNRAARAMARWAWVEAGSPKADGPVRVSVTVRRARRMDQLNIWGACKALADGVFVGAATPDDSEAWVRLGEVIQEIGARWKGREEVEFRVESVGEVT